MTSNGWDEHKIHINAELHRMSNEISDLREAVIGMREDISAMKAKFLVFSGVFGVVGGGITTAFIKVWGH